MGDGEQKITLFGAYQPGNILLAIVCPYWVCNDKPYDTVERSGSLVNQLLFGLRHAIIFFWEFLVSRLFRFC